MGHDPGTRDLAGQEAGQDEQADRRQDPARAEGGDAHSTEQAKERQQRQWATPGRSWEPVLGNAAAVHEVAGPG